MTANQERMRAIRQRVAEGDTWPSARDDVRWLLAQLAIASSREEQLLALIEDAANRLRIAPCQDVVRPIERILRNGLSMAPPSYFDMQREQREQREQNEQPEQRERR